MASLKEFLGSTGLGALWARITEELNKKATSADLADVATSGSYNDLEDKPFIPSAVSDLTDDSGHYTKPANGIPASDLEETYLTSFTETDPTVPSWAKEAEKPTYTAAEVDAMATSHPANNITAGNIENWTKQTNLLSVDSDHNNAYDYWWTLTIPRNALWNINNAPGSSGNLKYLYVPSTTGSNLVKLELPTSNGKLALISDTPAWARATNKPTYTAQEVGALPADTIIPTVPTNVSAFTNDAGYLTQHQDISGKADKSEIPTSISELTNDAGYITGYTETDPTVPAWAKASTKPSYTAAEVGAPTVAEMNSAIGNAIGNVHQFEVEIVQELPVENIKEHTVYFVPKEGATDDVYDEYVYIDNAWEMIGNTQIDLSNYVQKDQIATGNNAGLVKVNPNYGIKIEDNIIKVVQPQDAQIVAGLGTYTFITAAKQHMSAFFGLAKAAGDTTQVLSSNPVGTYTDEAKTAIRTMLGVATPADIPTNVSAFTNDAGYLTQHQDISGKANVADLATVATSGSYEDLSDKPTIPEVPVEDVQINDVSILNNRIVKIPIATNQTFGVIKAGGGLRFAANEPGKLMISSASTGNVRTGDEIYPICGNVAHAVAFFGLAKAAGNTTQQNDSTIGVYNNDAKQKIQNMLGITDLLSTEESSTATAAHVLNSTFMMDGKLYKATAAIAIGEAVVEGQNCEVVKADEVFVKNTDIATRNTFGLVSPDISMGTDITNGKLIVYPASIANIKAGTDAYRPITPSTQDSSTYYGLSKLAGVDLKNETVTVGTYPETSKTAIRSLIGAAAASDIPSVPVQDVQVNGTSVLSSGVANVPIMSASVAGVAKVAPYYGLDIITSGNSIDTIRVYGALSTDIKTGTNAYRPIVPNHQHESVFYGLTKAAGVDMSSSSNAVGTYTETAKTAIRSMIGATSSNVIAVQDTQPVEADAKIWMMETAPESVEIPTMEDLEGYVQKTDYASADTAGVIKVSAANGIQIYSSGLIATQPASTTEIKAGTGYFKVVVPYNAYEAAFYGLAKAAGDTTQSASSNAVGTYTDGAKTAIRNMLGAVGDVQINGTSITSSGVANIPICSSDTFGVVKVDANSFGIKINESGRLYTDTPGLNEIKVGTQAYKPIVPATQHSATFYGLAKAAGDTTMASSSNAVGTYTTEAKAAIHTMLGIDPASIAAQVDIPLVETVSGTTPTITGQPNVRYVCGEVSTITITPPASGSVDVIFESGSTATAMTVPSTVKWPAWFDAEALEINTTYEILITDGIYGSVMTWAT